jgi:hypothetical protein
MLYKLRVDLVNAKSHSVLTKSHSALTELMGCLIQISVKMYHQTFKWVQYRQENAQVFFI